MSERLSGVVSLVIGVVSGALVIAIAGPVLGTIFKWVEYLLGAIIGWGGRYGADPFWGYITGWGVAILVGFFTGSIVFGLVDAKLGGAKNN